ncbi:MAG TPA: hypothetical protein VKY57_03435, partial [Chitinispirillaceae bacterium]|nr:hypothetical protein [Chitinispirillaceae bacterium]
MSVCRIFFTVTFFLFLAGIHFPLYGAIPPGIDCAKWKDSLITAGISSLQNNKIDSARFFFAAAYDCGMSRDSMYYFAAEVFLQSGVFDTALVFNWALQNSGNFDPKTCQEQHNRIQKAIECSRKKKSSRLVDQAGKKKYSIVFRSSAERNKIKLNPVSFIPYAFTYDPHSDIDDAGKSGITCIFSRYTGNPVRRLCIRLAMDADLPLPTKYSFSDTTDTLKGLLGFSGGIGNFPKTPELQIGYQVQVHSTLRTDNFYRLMFTCAPSKTIFLSTDTEIKQVTNEGIVEYRTDLTMLKKMPHLRNCNHFAVQLQHIYSSTDIYQDETGVSSALYPFLPVGYVDSIVNEKRFQYYYDNARLQAFNSVYLNDYWAGQPNMKLIRPYPEHQLNVTLRNAWRFFLPLRIRCDFSNSFTGTFYTKPVEWFEPEELFVEDVGSIYRNMKLKYAIIYNAADGEYYLNMERSDLYPNSVIRLDHYRKWRIDYTLFLSLHLERMIRKIGAIYCFAGYIKGFSTIASGDPIVTFNYGWDLQAGWRMNFSV